MLRHAGSLNPQQWRSHSIRPYHPGGLQISPIGSRRGSPHPSQVRYAGDLVLPPGGGEEGSEDGEGGFGPEALYDMLGCAPESVAILYPVHAHA